jgi:AcrR family transcriptional regulator
MSRVLETSEARAPKRERGKQRVASLLEAAAAVFVEKGYEAATMTEIAARAGAPIGSLYQFFPGKEALADTLLQHYAGLLAGGLETLEGQAATLTPAALAERLLTLMQRYPKEREVAHVLADVRLDESERRAMFRQMLRKHIAAVLRAHAPRLEAARARDMALVVLQLIKAVNTLNREEQLPGRAAAARELGELITQYLEERVGVRDNYG